MRKISFTGTVIDIADRFSTTYRRAFVVSEPNPSWVVAVDIEEADELAPRPAGSCAAFFIHSPAQTFRMDQPEVIGRRFAFEIERREEAGRITWSMFSAFPAPEPVP